MLGRDLETLKYIFPLPNAFNLVNFLLDDRQIDIEAIMKEKGIPPLKKWSTNRPKSENKIITE